MIDLFGENKIKKVKSDSISSKKEIKVINRMLMRDKNCQEAIKQFPKENEVASFVSKGLSDAGSFLYAFAEENNVIDEAVIATWTISINNVMKILDYVDSGKIKKLTMLLNDGLLKTNSTKPIYAFMRLEFDKRKDKISYAVANSHAKIQMYKSGGNYVTISGSANWSENPRIENYIVVGGKDFYDFNVKWIKDVVENG